MKAEIDAMNSIGFKGEFDFINSFPPLGHPEHHFKKYAEHNWLKSKNKIYGWLKYIINGSSLNKVKEIFIVHDDMTVSTTASKGYIIVKNHITHIPIQFRNVGGLKCVDNGLKSLIGSPYSANSLNFNNNEIDSFKGMSNSTIESLQINYNKIVNFKEMPNFKSSQSQLYVAGNPIESWDGFKEVELLVFWQKKVTDKTKEFFLDVPRGLSKLNVLFRNKDFHINSKGELDMDWLREFKKANSVLTALENNENERVILKRRKI